MSATARTTSTAINRGASLRSITIGSMPVTQVADAVCT